MTPIENQLFFEKNASLFDEKETTGICGCQLKKRLL